MEVPVTNLAQITIRMMWSRLISYQEHVRNCIPPWECQSVRNKVKLTLTVLLLVLLSFLLAALEAMGHIKMSLLWQVSCHCCVRAVSKLYRSMKLTTRKVQLIFFTCLTLSFLDIIKLFNPSLLGASPGKTVHGMQAHISETGFNLAVTGHNTL